VLSSPDLECLRLGSTILRNCLRNNENSRLLSFLEQEPQLLQRLCLHLSSAPVSPGSVSCDPSSVCTQREIQRQVASVLQALVRRRGAAFLNHIAPGAADRLQTIKQTIV
jgi:hypothetical protein